MLHDLIIIGGGPAGITAGIYAARKKLNTLLITKDFFGQISSTSQVDNWPGEIGISGIDLMRKLEKHLREFCLKIEVQKTVAKIWKKQKIFYVQTQDNGFFQARALIIATGRHIRPLGIEGEEKFVGKGLSYCSICDAPFFQNKQVAVIGGGNAGFEAALDLAKYAKSIFIFEKDNTAKADELLQEQAQKTGKIKVVFHKQVLKIEGNQKVEAIIYKDTKTNKIFQQPMEGVFVYIGSVPTVEFLGKMVGLNKNKEIKVNPRTMATSCEGIFAAGDCNDSKWKQMIVAAGQGAVAALSAHEYLMSGNLQR